MIVDLHKYLIFGNQQEMDRFFSLAQRAGFLEFIGSSHKRALELPETAKTLLGAIRIAKHHPVHPQEAPPVPLEPEALAKKILSLYADHEHLLEEERMLSAEIARISIFGDFSREKLDLLERDARRVFQFYCMKSSLAREMTLPSEVIYVGTEYDLDYFVGIHKERRQYPKMIEILIDRPVGDLRQRLLHVREEMAKTESDLRTYANTLPILQKGLIECLNAHHLRLAKHDATLTLNDSLFAIEAWVPKTKIKALYGLLGGLNVDCTEIAIEKRDRIPTYMENKGAAKLGEDLVLVYDTPAHTDKDPSLWVLCFFSFFFSIIISDAGYGLIFLLLALFLKWKFPHLEGIGKRFLRLTLILSICCITWGVLTASYFGIELHPENPLQKTSFISYLSEKKGDYHLQEQDDVYEEYLKKYPNVSSARDGRDFLLKASKIEGNHRVYAALDDFHDNIFMEFSLVVGMIHISLSFLRYLTRNWAGLGWVVFILGGYLFFPSVIHATTALNFMGWVSKPVAQSVGLQLLGIGLVMAFLGALVKKKWGAFTEILHVVQLFADVLSYLRLYALSLGGMVMAETFNAHLGIDIGLIGTIALIFFGHLININLSIMGGVIHGLRLNFLEWYHYCFQGDGRLFNPLRLRRSK